MHKHLMTNEGLEIRKIWRWPKMATARVFAVAMATAKLPQQKWPFLKWSLIQRSLYPLLDYWKSFWMGFNEFTKMAITSLKIGHFHPDFAKSRWPFLATAGLSGGGHCGGQLPWPPRISRPAILNFEIWYFSPEFLQTCKSRLCPDPEITMISPWDLRLKPWDRLN